MPDTDWHAMVKNILKGELKRRGTTYQQLSERLAEMGINETEKTIRNKLSRGGFSATFFIQALVAVGCQSVRLAND